MKTRYSLLYCVALLALTAPSVMAQGTGFTYQGHLELNGAAVASPSDLTFTLFDAPTGGNQVGSSVISSDVVVSNGLFNVVLDFGSNAFDGSARWLEIEVRAGNSTGAFTKLAPRQSVTPAPYAIFASKVAAAGLAGKISGSQIANGSIGADQLANTIGLWNRAGDDLAFPTGSIRVVGSSPASGLGYPIDWKGLYVNNTASPGLAIVEGKGVARLHLRDANAPADNRNFAVDNSENKITFRWLNDTLGQRKDAITINPDGLVGINTGKPTERLSVVGNTLIQGTLAVEGTVVATKGGFGTSTPSTALHIVAGEDTELSIESDANHRRWTLQASGGSDGVGNGGTFQIIDRTAQASRVLIGVNGNVGIGVTSPATKLDVDGEVTMTACNITSDRHAKEGFKPINSLDVLEKVAQLPISEWQYKTQAGARHIGPMAQDFRAAFSLGHDEKHITTVDADGVALAAIQGLNQLVQEQRRTIQELHEQQHQLAQRFAERLAELEKKISDSRLSEAAAKHEALKQ